MNALPYIRTNKANIFLQEVKKADNPIILWLHGFCEDHQIFMPLIESLKFSAYHIVPDFPGYGKSQPSNDFDFSMHSFAQTIFEALDNLNIHKIHCIGHSMGGYIGLELAHLYPPLIQSLTLFHSTAAADTAMKRENRNRTIEIVKKDLSFFLREFYQNLFAPENKTTFKLEIEQLRNSMSKDLKADTVNKTLIGLRDRKDFIETLKSRRFALNYIIGTHDAILPANEIIEQAKMLNAHYEILENSGHMGMIEEKEQLTNILHNLFILT